MFSFTSPVLTVRTSAYKKKTAGFEPAIPVFVLRNLYFNKRGKVYSMEYTDVPVCSLLALAFICCPYKYRTLLYSH